MIPISIALIKILRPNVFYSKRFNSEFLINNNDAWNDWFLNDDNKVCYKMTKSKEIRVCSKIDRYSNDRFYIKLEEANRLGYKIYEIL